MCDAVGIPGCVAAEIIGSTDAIGAGFVGTIRREMLLTTEGSRCTLRAGIVALVHSRQCATDVPDAGATQTVSCTDAIHTGFVCTPSFCARFTAGLSGRFSTSARSMTHRGAQGDTRCIPQGITARIIDGANAF